MLETKLRTKGIDYTVLHVKDVAKSRKFYLDVLGMTVNHEDAIHTFLWCGGGQMVALFQVGEGTDIKPGDDINHMALRIESGTYEEVKAYLESNGATVFGHPGDDRCIYFDDPDEHRLQIMYPDSETQKSENGETRPVRRRTGGVRSRSASSPFQQH